MASVGGLLSGDSPATRRRFLRQRKRHFAHAFGAAAVLISLAAMGLVMWFIGVVGPQVQEMRRGFLSHSAAASASAAQAAASAAASAEEPTGIEGLPASSGGKESIAAGNSSSGASSSAMAVLPIADLRTMSPTPPKSRGFECLSQTYDTTGGVVYPNSTNVTKWRTNEGLDAPCPVVSNRSAELLIREDGQYFLYSQALLSGVMNEGVVLRTFDPKIGRQSLRIKHAIVCWQNCAGARDRHSGGAVILREAEVTILDLLSSYVAVQVRLMRGSTVGVMVTSSNVTGNPFGAWLEFVLGVVPAS